MHDDARVISSTRIVAALTLFSRVLGLIRDAVCSHFFGAGLVYGAFSIAFQIPNLFRRLFGEGALSAASIPIFSAVLTRDGRENATLFASRLITLLVVVLSAIAVVGEVVLVVLSIVMPDSERTRLTLLLTAIMAPYVIIVCTIAVMGGLLNVLHSFALPTIAPIVLNVVMIVATIVGTTVFRGNDQAAILLLAGSVMAGGVLQLIMQLRGLRSLNLPVRLELTTRDANVRRVMRTMAPMTLGLAAVQVNTLADTLIAAACVPHPGAPAILFYAQRMYQFPLGVFAIAYAVVLFPTLSAKAAADEMDAFRRTLAGGINMVMFVGLPCTAGLMLIAQPCIELLFEHGEFTAADTVRVSRTLVAYSSGIWAYGLLHVLVRAFYALHDPVRPTMTATVMVFVNLALNLSLVWSLQEAGLGWATAICAALQCVWLAGILSRRLGRLDWGGVGRSVGKSLLATAVMSAGVLQAMRFIPALNSPRMTALLLTAVPIALGAGLYAGTAAVTRSQEFGQLLHRGR